MPRLVGALAPSAGLHPSQERARDLFFLAQDAEPETIREIGHAALAAQAPGPSVMPRNVALMLGVAPVAVRGLHITCVDAFTGERCVVTGAHDVRRGACRRRQQRGAGVVHPRSPSSTDAAWTVASAAPAPTSTWSAGARRAGGAEPDRRRRGRDRGVTSSPTSVVDELAALEASGTGVFHRMPETMDILTLMDPAAVPDAIAMGERQAAADVDELQTFLR